LEHWLRELLLATDGVRYFIGEEGEQSFGRRNFLELVSIFTAAPVLSVTDGRNELGAVDQNLFLGREPAEDRLLSLAGRSWRVEQVDWKDRRVYVTPADLPGKTVWFGTSAGLSLTVARAIRAVLVAEHIPPQWSQRTTDQMRHLR